MSALFLCLRAVRADDAAPAAMPAEVVLANGHEFRVIAVVRWLSDGVVVKHPGGADPFRYEYMSVASKAAWQSYSQAVRSAAEEKAKKQPATEELEKATAPKSGTVTGQIYAKGLDQPYKFSSAVVHFYLWEQAKDVDLNTINKPMLPDEIATAVTDVEGKFSIDLPAGDYMALVQEDRHYRGGGVARYLWRCEVAVKNGTSVAVAMNDLNASVEPIVVSGHPLWWR